MQKRSEETKIILSLLSSSFRTDFSSLIICLKMLILYIVFSLIVSTMTQQQMYNFFLPDLPSNSRVSSSSFSTVSMTRETHSFTSNRLTKLHIQGGPFTVKLYRNGNESHMSIDVEAEPSIHRLIQMETDQQDRLIIRLIETADLLNRSNVSLLISYGQLQELEIDGHIHLQCLNQIQTDTFRLINRGQGSMRFKLNVNILDGYLHSIGRVKFCGQVNDEATLKSLGVGDVDARKLLTKRINVISSGIGNLYVTATDEINIVMSGIGTVYYSGPLKQQMKTGLGNFVEMQDNSFVNSQ